MATVEAILDVGAKPIIVGVDDSLNIDIDEAKRVTLGEWGTLTRGNK